MANILEYQKKDLEKLGDDKVGASLDLHRKKLSKVSDKALNLLDEDLPTSTTRDRIAIYDTTRKHLNVLDGRTDLQVLQVFNPPPELMAHYSLQDEIKAQIIEDQKCKLQKKSVSTQPKEKSLPTPTDSELLIADDVSVKLSSQYKK